MKGGNWIEEGVRMETRGIKWLRECHPQGHSSIGEMEVNGLVLHKSKTRSGKVGISTAPLGESVIREG